MRKPPGRTVLHHAMFTPLPTGRLASFRVYRALRAMMASFDWSDATNDHEGFS